MRFNTYSKRMIRNISYCLAFVRLILVTSAMFSDEHLRVAMHDRCNEDDTRCGLPDYCCCKPSHFDLRLNLANISNDTGVYSSEALVNVLCVNNDGFPQMMPANTETFKMVNSSMSELTATSINASALEKLTNIYIWKNKQLTTIRDYAFSSMENLRTIILEDLPSLTVIERHGFWNLANLRELRLKRTGIFTVPLFSGLSSSEIPLEIILEETKITRVYSGAFSALPERIKVVQLSWNQDLTYIEDFAFNGSYIAQLILNNNKQLTAIGEHGFYGLDSLTKLSISDTPISVLPVSGLRELVEIDARKTPNLHRFPTAKDLPSLRVAFLTYTYHCCALNAYGYGNTFEDESEIKQRQIVPCNYNASRGGIDVGWSLDITTEDDEDVELGPDYETGSDFSGELFNWNNYTIPSNIIPEVDTSERMYVYKEPNDHDAYDGYKPFLHRIGLYDTSFNGEKSEDYEDSTGGLYSSVPGGWRPDTRPEVSSPSENHIQQADSIDLCYIDKDGNVVRDVYRTPVRCTPKPDAFNPCENVLGNPVLPAISWAVSALAIFGNFVVILVLSLVSCDRSSSRQHNPPVQRFLVLNLAFADMCMGLYLLMVSAMDARSSGEYFKYGVEWQTGIGCRIAGFLSIFSSQLSVYTLSVISMERWYAIHYAIHLDKRMTMPCARICIAIGWIISGLLATLPLVGVNNYERTSICLPFDISEDAGMAYVAVLLFIAISAFSVDVVCYLWMYTTVRTTVSLTEGTRDSMFNRRKRRSSISSSRSGTISPTDAKVAKRMAILVFTNFACFFPISFFALTAATGSPLISISQSKILLVVFYPLNSCCNPFLYAILTKSFRGDLLYWFTSRGHCIPLAAKLHGAQWRRNSADPGSADKRDMCVRKRLQQCVKYVSKRKTAHIGVNATGNGSPDHEKEIKIAQSASPVNQTKPAMAGKHKMKTFSKNEFDNNSNSFTSYHSMNNAQTPYLGMSRIFKLAFMRRKSDKKTPRSSANYERATKQRGTIFPQMKWFRSHRKSSGVHHVGTGKEPASRPRVCSDSSHPLVEMTDSRMGCEYSTHAHDRKPIFTYERRASRSRHSTTTIETRLTVAGNIRGSVDHEPVIQDEIASTP